MVYMKKPKVIKITNKFSNFDYLFSLKYTQIQLKTSGERLIHLIFLGDSSVLGERNHRIENLKFGESIAKCFWGEIRGIGATLYDL